MQRNVPGLQDRQLICSHSQADWTLSDLKPKGRASSWNNDTMIVLFHDAGDMQQTLKHGLRQWGIEAPWYFISLHSQSSTKFSHQLDAEDSKLVQYLENVCWKIVCAMTD